MKKDLTCISDLAKKEIIAIVKRAFEFKAKSDCGIRHENLLNGKFVAMIFEKPSLRTKVAFELAAAYLGGIPIFLTSSQILASGGGEHGRESIPDIARNLERFVDLVLARVYSHDTIKILAKTLKKPVINALCDKHHPTQALADLMAITRHKKSLKNLKVAFIGDGNNVATSLMQICATVGINFAIASPKGYEIPIVEQTVGAEMAKKSGVSLHFLKSPKDAAKNADVIYTDTFISMGQENEKAKRLRDFKGYCVDSKLLKFAKPDAIFMHCLPAHRGEEVTNEVMDCQNSIVFDQAECRMHIAKSLLTFYL
ncbi:ornithine carbamoyltransferase [Candidatus Peregrinibacteria bacterium]|nr:ornithine carbamoyltransferase [Candidatus Peregrinibacteria bacterium]